jgi:hypothetical protein
LLLAPLVSRKANAAESLVYFGTYTNKGKSKGIYVSHFKRIGCTTPASLDYLR